MSGADPGGAAPGAPPPPKIGKIWFFGVKSWFFTRNTPKIFAPPSARRKFFKCAPPLTWNPGSAPVCYYLISNVQKLYLYSFYYNVDSIKWNLHEPGNARNREDCVLVTEDTEQQPVWYPDKCSHQHQYICRICKLFVI